MFGLGMPEVVVLAVLGLLLFGNRLPDMARSLGKMAAEFRKGINGLEDDLTKGIS
jgi:sec-independent protein translocase protein TatA